MGVDISAYSWLHLVPAHVDLGSADAYCEDEDHVEAYTQACFARSADGLADADVVVKTANEEWVATRCYERTSETRRESVLSMAYSGYNRWRAALSENSMMSRNGASPRLGPATHPDTGAQNGASK